jgi:uncharacterized protein YgfB (UPF0149 family)
MLQVTFAEVARVLEGLGSSVPATEAHGCLCGALCTSAHYPMDRWLEEIIPDEERRSDDDSQQVLRLLYADTLNAMRGDEMSLEVLLPDDDVPLEVRAGGLSQWCQGFLYGFGTGQPVDASTLPENVDEILRDLTHIGRATVSLEAGEGDNEEEEEAYTEVVEYVRVGVQLIHDELIEVRSATGASADEAARDPDAADDANEDKDGDGDDGEHGTLH